MRGCSEIVQRISGETTVLLLMSIEIQSRIVFLLTFYEFEAILYKQHRGISDNVRVNRRYGVGSTEFLEYTQFPEVDYSYI